MSGMQGQDIFEYIDVHVCTKSSNVAPALFDISRSIGRSFNYTKKKEDRSGQSCATTGFVFRHLFNNLF